MCIVEIHDKDVQQNKDTNQTENEDQDSFSWKLWKEPLKIS